MCNGKGCGFQACGCLGILISIVIGAIVGVLFAFGFIPFIVVSVWIAFGIAAVVLILLIAGLYLASAHSCSPLSKCLCQNGICLMVGAIGTLITALAALSIVLTPGSILVAALIALGALFFALTILSLISFIVCLVKKLCNN